MLAVRKCLIVPAVESHGDAVGRMSIRHVPNASESKFARFRPASVESGSIVHADGWSGYTRLERSGYRLRGTPVSGHAAITGQVRTLIDVSGRVYNSIHVSQTPLRTKTLPLIGEQSIYYHDIANKNLMYGVH